MQRINYLTKNDINAKLHQTSDAFVVSITHKRPLPVTRAEVTHLYQYANKKRIGTYNKIFCRFTRNKFE